MDIAVLTRPVAPRRRGPAATGSGRGCRPTPSTGASTPPCGGCRPSRCTGFVDVDHDRREAVVAVVGDEVVGVARYDRSPDDDTPRRVRGPRRGRLAGPRRSAASCSARSSTWPRRRGVRTATASVQADNERTLALLRRLLPGSRFVVDSAVYALTGPLVPPCRPHPGGPP